MLDEAAAPGSSVSEVARRYGVSPSLLFRWRRPMDECSLAGLDAGENVVPQSEARQLQAQVRELERLLGRKTLENEVLRDAVRLAREKQTALAVALVQEGHAVKTVSDVLDVSRSNLTERLMEEPKPRAKSQRCDTRAAPILQQCGRHEDASC